MSDTYITDNLNLTLPTVGTRTGTEYASDINDAFERIDAHDHSSGNGVQVSSAGLNIDADLDINSYNLEAVRAVRITDQTTDIAEAGDIQAVYSKNGDLYWNNENGTHVQITDGGQLNSAAIVSNNWEQTTISGNTTIGASATYVNILCNIFAHSDITLPAANGVSAGRYYVIQDISGTFGTISGNIDLVAVGADTINGSGSVKLATNNGTWVVSSDGVNKWALSYSAFSGLTSTALTYGSTVLNATSLTTGTLTASGNATVSGTGYVGGTFRAVGASTLSGNVAAGGTLAVTGATTLSSTLAAGASTLASLGVTANATVGGTLAVTGTTTLGNVTLGGTLTGGSISGATITGGSVGAASGLATLTSGSKLTQTQRAGWYVSNTFGALSGNVTVTTYGSWVDISGLVNEILVQADDIVIIDCAAAIWAAGAATNAIIRWTIKENLADTASFGTATVVNTADTAHYVSANYVYQVVSPCTLNVRGQLYTSKSTDIGGTSGGHTSSIRLLAFRP